MDEDEAGPSRRSGQRPKKRKFHGNRHTTAAEERAAQEELEAQARAEAEARRVAEELARGNQPVGTRTRRRGRASKTVETTPATPVLPAPAPPSADATTSACASAVAAETQPERPSSASSHKLRRSADPVVSEMRQDWNGFRIIDLDILFTSITSELVCKQCQSSAILMKETKQCGFSSIFSIKCFNCERDVSFRNSEMIAPNISEINRRSVYAFKSLGLSYEPYKEFCALMDFPPPVARATFDRAVDAIQEATETVAEESMDQAAREEEELNNEDSNVTVSGDGSWQKRGFTSLFGVVTLIGLLTGKVIDFFVLSLVCKVCDAFKGEKSGLEYERWKEEHEDSCTKNHQGSSGKMEVDGMLQLFGRSVEKRKLRYAKYIGDGDAKTYKAVTEKNPYADNNLVVEKMECTAHVQKRMGTRLRNLKKELKSTKLSDGLGIGGRGRLTDKIIDLISVYYGMAIRSSTTVQEMSKKVWAIYHHMSSSDRAPSHQFCPKGADSWCTYQKAVAAKQVKQYKHKAGVPKAVMEACKKVFEDLTKPELLSRCIGGHTQNPNESLNNLIWVNCPKSKFFGKKTVDIAACEATINFNDGCRGKIKVLEEMGVKAGKNCVDWAIKTDNARIKQADQRALESTKEARIAKKKARDARERLQEDDSYAPGGH